MLNVEDVVKIDLKLSSATCSLGGNNDDDHVNLPELNLPYRIVLKIKIIF